MANVHHPFAMDGEAKLMGHRIQWHAMPHRAYTEFTWKGHVFQISDLEFLQKGYAGVADMAQRLEGHT